MKLSTKVKSFESNGECLCLMNYFSHSIYIFISYIPQKTIVLPRF